MISKLFEILFVFTILLFSFGSIIFLSFKVADLTSPFIQAGLRGEVGRYVVYLLPVLILPVGSILWLKNWDWSMGSGIILIISLLIVPPIYAFFLNLHGCVDTDSGEIGSELAVSYLLHSGLGGPFDITDSLCAPIYISIGYLGLFTLGLIISMLWVFMSPNVS